MSDTVSSTPVAPAGAGAGTSQMADMNQMMAQQQQMFHDSMIVNMEESSIQTWGNLGENVAKGKPQV